MRCEDLFQVFGQTLCHECVLSWDNCGEKKVYFNPFLEFSKLFLYCPALQLTPKIVAKKMTE